MKRWLKLAAGAAALTLATAGCAGSSGSDTAASSSGNAPLSGTVTVWLMTGSAPATLTDALNKEFEAAHPGVKVKYEVQQWDGIQQKLTTALASGAPPDVIEIGNTQTAAFASQDGVLTDLTADKDSFNGSQWLKGLADSGSYDGKTYGVPFYAANREVIYRKDMFEQAGIAKPPASNDEWIDAIGKLKTKFGSDPDFQALYMPGQNWYALLSFIWDNGGDIAKADGKNYKATLDTPEAKAGLDFYKKLVDTSGTKAPKDADEAKPQQATVYGAGKVAMMIGLPWELATAAKTDASLTGKTGAFAIPSKTAGQSAPVFLGGSNLAIPANSKNVAAAKEYIKLLASQKYQGQLAAAGVVPGTSTDLTGLDKDPLGSVMAKASANGKAVPASPKWGDVESGQNPVKDMLTAYLTGKKTLDQATADANAALNKLIGG
ncbi:sugar ABC transporter periplasmic protein [Amycolatopsis mediterranei S699]|uniref:Periplasmic substrate-binding component of ABC-type sugar transport system n=2 Tax=Amycolatopsis mediterranei TaxID=33910 RepID=A0A0H3D560_AMYMU|nr:sugar ABC transporter substrate-binding protein [Amycolatopsis mediterranei]ADJ46135.1 periplasmic substrate-binding component of ABC-type sugar transport system [Amycolatopsis mediterranei U32]AEK42923.1 sugar ABC transporter periplasmic protein [Amycolatopsis mediterranei S699]AFO77846.1 sugar ABC transporter periplasmic protein [Amycolatopsis mediterranei S699]AGT84974.1 sugar ABC transporter periplasmic protein [Amycolatopsis mediterranei RB]KDO05671.1 sugar ABC transporter substrate-bi